jgi:hypothetical protein
MAAVVCSPCSALAIYLGRPHKVHWHPEAARVKVRPFAKSGRVHALKSTWAAGQLPRQILAWKLLQACARGQYRECLSGCTQVRCGAPPEVVWSPAEAQKARLAALLAVQGLPVQHPPPGQFIHGCARTLTSTRHTLQRCAARWGTLRRQHRYSGGAPLCACTTAATSSSTTSAPLPLRFSAAHTTRPSAPLRGPPGLSRAGQVPRAPL